MKSSHKARPPAGPNAFSTSLGANAPPGGDTLARGTELTSSKPRPACLTSEERRVWELIPHGRARAIKQSLLADAVGLSTRTLQHVLKDLTEVHGLPVASACSKPMGVFIPETEAEVDAFIEQLTSRALSCFRRIKALKVSAAMSLATELQTSLPLRDAIEPEEPCTVRSRAPRRCLTCSAKFPAWRKDRKFCSDKCRMIYHGRARP